MTFTVGYWRNSVSLGKTTFRGCALRNFMLTAAFLLSAFVAPYAFGQTAGGYDILEISPPAGFLARRAWLSDHGVSVDFRYTSFYQGLASGTGDKDYNYGGKMDAFI